MTTSSSVREAEWDCLSVLNHFYRKLDAGDYDGIVALWATDGVWMRPDETVKATDIVANLTPRSRTAVRHHMLTSPLLTPQGVGPNGMDVSFYCVAAVGDSGSEPTGPLPFKFAKIFNCEASLRREGEATESRWVITRYAHGEATLEL